VFENICIHQREIQSSKSDASAKLFWQGLDNDPILPYLHCQYTSLELSFWNDIHTYSIKNFFCYIVIRNLKTYDVISLHISKI